MLKTSENARTIHNLDVEPARSGQGKLPSAADFRRISRPGPGQGTARTFCPRRPRTRRGAGSHPALRPAGTWENHARVHHRQRAWYQTQKFQRSGDRKAGRSRGAVDFARTGRRALHRRDPPPERHGRRVSVQRDGGFLHRHHARTGRRGAFRASERAALHLDRGDDPAGDDLGAAPGALRLEHAPRLLRHRESRVDPEAFRRDPRRRARRRRRRRDRFALPRNSAHRQQPLAAGAGLRAGAGGFRHHRLSGGGGARVRSDTACADGCSAA